jgi:Domain of unknown function (DUF4136)
VRIAQKRTVLALIAALAAGLCLGKVKVEYDKKVDLSRYKTYEWYPPRVLTKAGIVEDDKTVSPLIRAAVNRQLSSRGLTEVPSGADLKVSSWALSESVPNIDALIYPGAIPVGAGSMIDPAEAPIASVGRYNKEGTIVVNLIDAKTKKSVGEAVATESYSDLNKLQGPIDKAVTNMFKKYPIKAK